MTQEYEKSLIDYITKIVPSKPTSEETYKSIKLKPYNEWSSFLPISKSSVWNTTINGIIKSNTSDVIVAYGEYIKYEQNLNYDIQNNSKGFVIILDGNLKPIKTIYNFASGTELRPIQKMIQTNDGTFIAIDSVVARYDTSDGYKFLATSQKRVIMLNNMSIPQNNDYNVILRKSYIINDNNFQCKDIYENPNSSHFTFMGLYFTTVGTTYIADGMKVIDLKINVGEENEWNIIQDDGNSWIYGGGYAYYDNNDNMHFKIVTERNVASDKNIYIWNNQGTSSILLLDYKGYVENNYLTNQSVFINENLLYIVINNQIWNTVSTEGKHLSLYEIDFTNNKKTEIFHKQIGNYTTSFLDTIMLDKLDGELYIQYCTNVTGDATDRQEVKTADYYYQRYNGIWKPIFIGNGNYRIFDRYLYVSKKFNLFNLICIQNDPYYASWYVPVVTEIYSKFNYNGLPYDDYNDLVPSYANVYKDDDVIFSRDLYNLSIIKNYSIATVQIPNNYLNDVVFNANELISKTNKIIVEEDRELSKNIYEALYLNYINTINVIDNNNRYVDSAGTYINQNVNIGTRENHENSKCSKVKINYLDDTTKIFDIIWVGIDDLHKKTEFSVFVDKEIVNIQFISNDETTAYITIKPSFELNKYYTIKQKLRIGDEI